MNIQCAYGCFYFTRNSHSSHSCDILHNSILIVGLHAKAYRNAKSHYLWFQKYVEKVYAFYTVYVLPFLPQITFSGGKQRVKAMIKFICG